MKTTEQRFHGQAASTGVVVGPLVRCRAAVIRAPARCGAPDAERDGLARAVQAARAELRALADREGGDVAAILEFQIEMLGDAALTEEALVAIEDGAPAAEAWWRGMTTHIESYRGSRNQYFRARTADLTDMRDRVGRLLGATVHVPASLPTGAIVLDEDLSPSGFLAADWTRLGGAALINGSPFSHVAMLARARGVPLVTGLGREPPLVAQALLDAGGGLLITDPAADTRAAYAVGGPPRPAAAALALRRTPTVTADGEAVTVMINIDDPDAVSDPIMEAADGIGLVRSEFLFMTHPTLPDEQAQYDAYTRLLARVGEKPCIVRTWDIGGDKLLPGIELPAQANPFLGLRGIRLCLDRPELFRPQVRALLRAAVDRRLKVMLPMVAVAEEYHQSRSFFADSLAALRAEGTPAAMPPLGIMVETPAAAIAIDTLEADFFSIGSNDLTQYTMAAARDGAGRLAALNHPAQTAVLRLIETVVRHGQEVDREVCLCGDMGPAGAAVGPLLQRGVRRFSVAPAALDRIRSEIRRFRAAGGRGST